MWRKRFIAFVLLLSGAGLGYYIYFSQIHPDYSYSKPFKYGLDIQGGTELVYQADTSKLAQADVRDNMNALRDVIERRVNLFGVSEPVVQIEEVNALSGTPIERLIVELPGVTTIQRQCSLTVRLRSSCSRLSDLTAPKRPLSKRLTRRQVKHSRKQG